MRIDLTGERPVQIVETTASHQGRRNAASTPCSAIEDLRTKVIDGYNLAVAAYAGPAQAEENKPAPPIGQPAVYLSPDEKSFDLLRPLLNSIGIPLKDQTLEPPQRILINGLSVGDSKLRDIVENWDSVEVRGVERTDEQASLFASGAAIRLPTTVMRMLEFFAE